MEIKETENFTDLAFKTTATLAQDGYSIEEAVRIGRRIEAIGQQFIGREYNNDYKTIQFLVYCVITVDIDIKFKNGTLTAKCCRVFDRKKGITITPFLAY
nr:MAG TPA: hypothetical protein [Caudoviricetes sp.]